jgi:hypothetical protein
MTGAGGGDRRHARKELDMPPIPTVPLIRWPALAAALAGALALCACGPTEPLPPTPAPAFSFTVHVQSSDLGRNVPRARVVLFAPGLPKQDELTDDKGYATFEIESSALDRTGDVEVTAPGYADYRERLQLKPAALPTVIRLGLVATPTPTPTSTPTPMPTSTSTSTPTSTSTSTSTPTPTPTPTPAPFARITSHVNGAQVARFISLIGEVSDNLTDALWVFVQPPKGHFYPQSLNACQGEGTPRLGNRWETRIGLGMEGDAGMPYEVILAAADAEADRYIKESLVKWCEENFYPGFNVLPPGVREMDRITLRRVSELYGPAPDASSVVLPGQAAIGRFFDDRVDANTTISGTFTAAITNDVWVLVYPYFGRWYPQSVDACVGAHVQRSSNGQWWVRGVFGAEGDSGKPFDIVVVMASSEASQRLDDLQREWCAADRYPGYLTIELPPGLMEKDRYRVTRK